MKINKLILITNVCATFFLTGLIWLVQVVHYPLFTKVGAQFVDYHHFHVTWISYVVVAPMIVEALSAALMLRYPYPGMNRKTAWVGFGLVVFIWGVTVLISVPAHHELARGFHEASHYTLMQSNLLRTMAWTLRAVLLSVLLSQMLEK